MKTRIEQCNGRYFVDYWIDEGTGPDGKPKGCWKNHSSSLFYDQALRDQTALIVRIHPPTSLNQEQ